MPKNPLKRLRNFGIVAHIDAGKTTVSERVLFYTGKEHAIGEVHDGTAKMDYLAEEQQRGITITAAATRIRWLDHDLNLIDTPGHVDFTAEVERSLRVLDGAVVVFDGVHGVEAQSETVWHQADRYRVPRICFINKMDRGGADFDRSCQTIQERLGARTAVLTAPIGAGPEYEGIVDLRTREALHFRGDQGAEVVRGPIPEALREEMEVRRAELLETLADISEAVMVKVLEEEEPTLEEIDEAIRAGTRAARIFPVLGGSALKNSGIQPLLDAVVAYLPSPLEAEPIRGHDPADPESALVRRPDATEPLCALAFKIVTDAHGDLTFVRVYSGTFKQGGGLYNPRLKRHERAMRILRMHANEREALPNAVAGDIVALVGPKLTATGDTLCEKAHPIALESIVFPEPVISMAIEPRSAADRERLEEVLTRLAREDPTFRTRTDEETDQTIISGMGELHLEVLRHRLVTDFGVQANVGRPRVSYRQTVRGPGEGTANFEHLIQGKEQRATVRLRVEPGPAGSGLRFHIDPAAGTDVPKGFYPAVEEGVLFSAQGGLDLGFPVIDTVVTLTGGVAHDAESTELAFSAAAGDAFRAAAETAGLAILQPIMRIEVSTPAEFVGPIQSDLARRGALVEGDDLRGEMRVIRGRVALSEMFGYSTAVRSLSQGRASYSMEPAGFAEVAPELARRLSFLE